MKFLIDLEFSGYTSNSTSCCWIHLKKHTTVFWNREPRSGTKHIGWFTMEFSR